MFQIRRAMLDGTAVGLTVVLAVVALPTVGFAPWSTVQAQAAAEPAPPADQSYIGAKKCASCHFEQYMTWKKDKHSKVFDLLPAKYKTDAACLKCHTTGHGTPTGFKDIASTPNLAGNTCEVCHGAGSDHEKIALKYGKEKLNADQEKEVRDSIWKMLPENVCVTCHLTKAHKESATPPELRSKD